MVAVQKLTFLPSSKIRLSYPVREEVIGGSPVCLPNGDLGTKDQDFRAQTLVNLEARLLRHS